MAVNTNYRSGILNNNTFEEKVEKSNISKPINSAQNSEIPRSKDLASKELAYATRATAMAQAFMGNVPDKNAHPANQTISGTSGILNIQLFDEVAQVSPRHKKLVNLLKEILPNMTYGVANYSRWSMKMMPPHAVHIDAIPETQFKAFKTDRNMNTPEISFKAFEPNANTNKVMNGEEATMICNENAGVTARIVDTRLHEDWITYVIYDKSHKIAHYSEINIPRTPENEKLFALKDFKALPNDEKLKRLEKAGAVAVDPSRGSCQLIKKEMDLHLDTVRTVDQHYKSLEDGMTLPFGKILILGSMNIHISQKLLDEFSRRYPDVIGPYTQLLMHVDEESKIHLYIMNLNDIDNIRSFEDEKDPDHKVLVELQKKILNDKESPLHDFLRIHNLPYKNTDIDNYAMSLTTEEFKREINFVVNSLRVNFDAVRDNYESKEMNSDKRSVDLLKKLLKNDPDFIQECCKENRDKEFVKELISYSHTNNPVFSFLNVDK